MHAVSIVKAPKRKRSYDMVGAFFQRRVGKLSAFIQDAMPLPAPNAKHISTGGNMMTLTPKPARRAALPLLLVLAALPRAALAKTAGPQWWNISMRAIKGAVMLRNAFLAFLLLFAFANGCLKAQTLPKLEAFPPASGKGAIVIVVSGASGPELYREYSAKLAQLGYYAVLVDGNDILIRSGADAVTAGAANLRKVISESQMAPQAIAGKVALVGFSLGGGGVLRHGSPLKDLVSGIVAYYPTVSRAGPDYTGPASEMQVPILILAGEKDHYNNCCLVESMRSLDAAAKARGASLELVIYPQADHAFNLATPNFRAADADDAWARTKAFLNRLQPPH